MSESKTWKSHLANRKRLRKKYLSEGQPDVVKNNLIKDLENYVLKSNSQDFQSLINLVYHPKGKNLPSWGDNPMFKSLIAICDQLFIYSEYLQEFLQNYNRDSKKLGLEIKSIVPAFALRPDTQDQNIQDLHAELDLKEQFLKKKQLEESPNKLRLFRIIDGKKTLSELWSIFNIDKEGKPVTKQYISQLIKDLEAHGVIMLKRSGKSKIPTRAVDFIFGKTDSEE